MVCERPSLNRVFLDLGPHLPTIYWYGVIIAAGALLALVVATKESNRLNMKKDTFIDLLVFAVPISIIFARIYYVIFEWQAYANGPWWDVFAIWNGGIAIHGALIGAVLTAIVFTRVRKESFWQLADVAAPSIVIGQAIGRWGNFMNQEAHGGPVSEAFYNNFMQYLPDFITNQMCIDGIMYHPTFLYESFWDIVVLILLLSLRRFNPMRGEIFLAYIMSYSVGRYFVEGMRMDSLYIGGIRQAQLISVVLIVLSIGLMIYRRKKHIAKVHYDGTKRKKKK